MSTQFDSQPLESSVGHSAQPGTAAAAAIACGAQFRHIAGRVVARYVAVGAILVALSELLWFALVGGPARLVAFSVLKSVVLLAVSGGVLHLLLRRSGRVLEQHAAELERPAWSASAEAFRRFAEVCEDVLWVGHPEKLELYYVNPAYESIWGSSTESLRGAPTSWLASVHPDDRDRLMSGMVRYATGNWDDTFRIVRPDGSIRWVRARSFMIRDAAGNVVLAAGVSRDVSESHSLREQLLQAQKMEPVGRLAGGIAHDFNNLLSVIVSYTGLLLAQFKPDDPACAELLEIRRAAERAADLTRQLLAFSRQQILRPRVLDLSQILLGMERMLGRLLREDIVLSINLPTTCASVHADPSQIEQVLMNLAVNARDAMPDGGRLTIDVAEVELDAEQASAADGIDPGRYVMLAVTDTGVGMAPSVRERMFEPFFTTKEKGKGTGLGLSTVFGIVKQSRGHLSVSTGLGRGTTIRVYLPATNLVPDNQRLQNDPPLPLIPIQGWETVLLVEDDEHVRAATRAILAKYGYRVLEARDGVGAIAMCTSFEGEIHLLLTDIVMPGMSGVILANQLEEIRPSMKRLFMSGYTDDVSVQQGELPGAAHLLAKPFPPELLLREVRRALLSPSAASSSEQAAVSSALRLS